MNVVLLRIDELNLRNPLSLGRPSGVPNYTYIQILISKYICKFT